MVSNLKTVGISEKELSGNVGLGWSIPNSREKNEGEKGEILCTIFES